MKYAIKYRSRAARLANEMNAEYRKLRKSADEAMTKGQYAKAVDLAADATEISALYMHIGFAIRPGDEREELREFNRETGQWYRAIEKVYEEEW